MTLTKRQPEEDFTTGSTEWREGRKLKLPMMLCLEPFLLWESFKLLFLGVQDSESNQEPRIKVDRNTNSSANLLQRNGTWRWCQLRLSPSSCCSQNCRSSGVRAIVAKGNFLWPVLLVYGVCNHESPEVPGHG